MWSERLQSGDATPADYARVGAQLGGEDWTDLDSSVLADLLRDKYGDLNPLAEAKLFYVQEVLGPPPARALHDPWLFEKMVCSFCGLIPDYDVWQTPSTEDVYEAVYRLKEIPNCDVNQIPEEVWRYAAACLVHDGCWCPPPGLEETEHYIREMMNKRGINLPSRSEVEVGDSLDAKLQREIWAVSRARVKKA